MCRRSKIPLKTWSRNLSKFKRLPVFPKGNGGKIIKRLEGKLLWPKVLRHLYIYHSESGTGISDISFEESAAPHYALVTGGLAGISSLIGEVTRREGKLTSIQQQDATILFFSGQKVTAALVAERTLDILYTKLKELVGEFEDLFNVYLREFAGDVEMFAPVESLVRRIFKPKLKS